MSVGDGDFHEPDFDRDVSLDAHLRDCPPTATTRGTFFHYVAKLAQRGDGLPDERIFDGVERRRWIPFKTYPLPEFMRLCHNVARTVYPTLRIGHALRRVGWVCYPSFAATMAGRVVLYAYGQRIDDVVLAAPKSYTHGLPGSSSRVSTLGVRHYRIELRDVYSFPRPTMSA